MSVTGSGERPVDDALEVLLENLRGIGSDRGERDESRDRDVAELRLDVIPGACALPRVRPHHSVHGLGDLAELLSDLEYAHHVRGVAGHSALRVEPAAELLDQFP